MAQDRGRGWQARARGGLVAARPWRLRIGLVAILLAAGVSASASVSSSAAPATAAASAPYYVLLLTNVDNNIYVGTETSLQSLHNCDLPDGGPPPCSTPITYTVELGPFTTCTQATAAYNAAAMNPHPAFGGTKVYIFGGSYFIDDMSDWCVPESSGTTTTPATTPATTTPTTTTTATTTTSEPTLSLPPVPTSFCITHGARTAATSAPTTVCAPHKALTEAEKVAARADLKGEVIAATVFCGAGGAIAEGRVPPKELALATGEFLRICPVVIRLMGDTLVQVHDPPATGFAQVALIVPGAAPPAPTAVCPTTAGAAACAALRAAAAKYAAAVTLTAEVTAAESLTLDRFAAAVAAQSVPGAFLQAALAKVYGGAVDGSLIAQQRDAQALATAFTNAGVDVTVQATAAVQAISQPSSTILSSTLLNQLVSDGVASSAALARQAIVAQLDTVSGTLDSSKVLDAALPATAFGSPYFAITLSDLKAIVKALAAQGAVAGKAATSLLRDLTAARKACGKRPAFIAATKRFSATATGVVKGEAGATLAFAVRPLTAASIPFASCA